MKHPPHTPLTRREFLSTAGRGASLLAFSRCVPAFLATTACQGRPERDQTILVLIQLIGGNDGFNTLVPFRNDLYYKARPSLSIDKRFLLPLSGDRGLHPALTPFRQLLDQGQLGIVQGVGYPNPNRSHFRSFEIWETASKSDEFLSSGWMGRYLSAQGSHSDDPEAPQAVHISKRLPDTLLSPTPLHTCGLATLPKAKPRPVKPDPHAEALLDLGTPSGSGNFEFLKQTMMNERLSKQRVHELILDYRPEAEYPDHELAQSLRSVAALISAGLPTRAYFVSLEGFDTHDAQLHMHHGLLQTLSSSMLAFQQDLDHRGLSDQVLTMTFSEFGRGLQENSSQGTDHGTAAPLFVMGSQVRGGFHGKAPKIPQDPLQDLDYTVDFRSVYATLLDRWLQWPSEDVLGNSFRNLHFIA